MLGSIKSIFSSSGKSASTDEPTVDDPGGEPVFRGGDWPYVWREDEIERYERSKKALKVISHGLNEYGEEQVFAGPIARRAIESHRNGHTDNLWLGCGSQYGEWASIPRSALRTHMAIFGKSGSGKSVCISNLSQQLIGNGSGYWLIDGDGQTVDEVKARLTEEQWERTMVIDPSADSGRADHVVGFNPLDVGVDPSHPSFDDLVGDRVRIIVREMIASEHGGGATIEGAAETMIRVAANLDKTFTIPDLFYIIKSKKRRQEFAEMAMQAGLDEEFLDYIEDIGEMPGKELDALTRRLKKWVEDPRAMRFIAHRESSISIPDLIDDGRIVLCKLDVNDDSLKTMFAQVIRASIWAAVEHRANTTRSVNRNMVYLIEDEYHRLVSKDEYDGEDNQVVGNIFSNARKKDLGYIVATQYPDRIPKDIITAIEGNVNTFMSFMLGSGNGIACDKLSVPKGTFEDEAPHHMWYRMNLEGDRERSKAIRTYTFPPMPPYWTEEEADQKERECVKRWGAAKKSNSQIRSELVFVGSERGSDVSEDQSTISPEFSRLTLHAIYDAEVLGKLDGDWGGRIDEIRRLTARHTSLETDSGDLSIAESQFQSTIDTLYERGHIEREMDGGETSYRVTPDGRNDVLFDQGDGQSGGGGDHHHLIRDLHEDIVRIGARFEIVPQGHVGDGDDDTTAPDGLYHEPIGLGNSMRENRRALSNIRSESAIRWGLTGGDDAHVELEKSTSEANPKQVCRNFKKGLDEGVVTMFVVPEWICSGEQTDPNKDPLRLASKVERYIHTEKWTDPADIDLDAVTGDDYVILVIPDGTSSAFDSSELRVYLEGTDQSVDFNQFEETIADTSSLSDTASISEIRRYVSSQIEEPADPLPRYNG